MQSTGGIAVYRKNMRLSAEMAVTCVWKAGLFLKICFSLLQSETNSSNSDSKVINCHPGQVKCVGEVFLIDF